MNLAKDSVANDHEIIGAFHEWMAGTCIPGIRRETDKVRIVFTTHATILGRYLAMNDVDFYTHLPFYDWAKRLKIQYRNGGKF
ncbi:MAG: hypothetical protein R3B47_14870 [Bacteroidia bacterium]